MEDFNFFKICRFPSNGWMDHPKLEDLSLGKDGQVLVVRDQILEWIDIDEINPLQISTDWGKSILEHD